MPINTWTTPTFATWANMNAVQAQTPTPNVATATAEDVAMYWAATQVSLEEAVTNAQTTPEPTDLPALHATIDEILTKVNTRRKSKDMLPPSDPRPVQELYKYPALKKDVTRTHAFEKSNPDICKSKYPWVSTHGIVGIEIEVENIKNEVPLKAYWNIKNDNSLRNNGIELVSNPLQIKQVEGALRHVYDALTQHNEPDFSNRTSIHIHLNCRNLSQDQIWNLVILYSLFEKHFYYIAGNKRLNSIFCVPLYRSNQLNSLDSTVYQYSGRWHKYNGLNILPLYDHDGQRGYGTIEFRHLYGTSDYLEIMDWINDIMCLRMAAIAMSKQELIELIKTMNTSSSYFSLYNQVFSRGRRVVTNKLDFEHCVSHIKQSLFGDDYFNYIRSALQTEKAEYWTLSRKLGIRG